MLHGLIELGGRLGIVTLGDLHGAVRARGRPNFGRSGWPTIWNAPGVYLFRGRDGRVLYVGKSVDLRSRVKSYFYGDGRKKVEDLLAETASVDGTCVSRSSSPDPRGAADPRARAEVQPPGKTWRKYAYLRIDDAEAYPRIKVVRQTKGGGAFLGPFPRRTSHAWRRRRSRTSSRSAVARRRCAPPRGSRRAHSPRCTDA